MKEGGREGRKEGEKERQKERNFHKEHSPPDTLILTSDIDFRFLAANTVKE
jgi:hypothetical protein